MSDTASASDVLDDTDPDTETDASQTDTSEGLDPDALNAVGVELATALLAGGIGAAAWTLPAGWVIVATFVAGGTAVVLADDWRVRAVGPFVIAGVLTPAVQYSAFAVIAAAALTVTVAGVYHHEVVALGEVV